MGIRKGFLATLAGLWLACAGTAYAITPPLDLTVGTASGLPGSVVAPTISFDIHGFTLTSFDLDLAFDKNVLDFLPGSSSVTYNGQTTAFTTFFSVVGQTLTDPGGQWHALFSMPLLANPTTIVNGPLLFTAKFGVSGLAPAGPTPISVAGSVSEDPVYEERFFAGTSNLTVSAVPEPELWLLWVGGLGMLAWRRAHTRQMR